MVRGVTLKGGPFIFATQAAPPGPGGGGSERGRFGFSLLARLHMCLAGAVTFWHLAAVLHAAP